MRFTVRIALTVLLAALSVSAGCKRHSSTRSTIPANGETNVNPRTVVAVRVSNTFSDADMANTDPGNWVVTGDLTATPYSGTITFAEWGRDVFAGQTVDDYEGSESPVSGTVTVDEDGEPVAENVELRKDTLVFELGEGESFEDGETITVFIEHDITARGTPIQHSKRFSFRVASSDRSTQGLFVESSDPAPGATLVDSRPRLAVRFNRGVEMNGLADSVHLRGAQSGAYAEAQLAVTETVVGGGAREIAVRLATGDSFLPGESVVLAVDSSTRETVQEDGSSVVTLDPYVTTFQVAGAVVEGSWSLAELTDGFAAPVAVVASNVDTETAGTEVFVVSKTAIDLLRQTESRSWESSRVSLPGEVTADGTFEPVAAVAIDTDGDGIQELVVLLTHTDQSRLQIFELDAFDTLVTDGAPVEFDGGDALSLTVVDLDASGDPELIVTLGGDGAAPLLFEFGQAELDPDSIDLSDPDSLLPRLTFVLQSDALPALAAGSRVVAADLDSDGRLDLIAETADGLHLLQNVGTGRTAIALRSGRTIAGPTSLPGASKTSAWAVSDLDQDGTQELLLWESGAADAVLFDGPNGLLAETAPTSSLLSLGVSPRTVLALDLDGMGRPDLAVVEENGMATLFLGVGAAELTYDRLVPVVGGGTPLALAAADLDGDSGIDLVSVAGDRVRFFLADDAVVPEPDAVSSFRIASELSSRSDQTLELVVLGDFLETFTGYSVALDYDEDFLTFQGFEAPPDLDSLATFTPCPNAGGVGCLGAAAVTMAYERSRGAAVADVVLGTFRFRLLEVTEEVTARIELTAFTVGEETFSNTVQQADGAASVTVPAAIEGEPFVVSLAPPPPPNLAVTCSVVARGDTELDGAITWTSPAELSFDGFEITVGGQVETVLPGTATSYQFTTGLISTVPVSVRGLDTDGATLATDECAVIGIHRPTVECVQVTPSQNRVSWTLHAVDRFEIFRNGELVATIGGTASQFFDELPTTTGSNAYEVVGFIDDTPGPSGSCDAVGDPDLSSTLPPEIISARLLARDRTDAPNAVRTVWSNREGYDRLAVTIERLDTEETVVSEELSGTQTQYDFEGNPASGGVPPGEYRFSITAFAGGVASEVVESGAIEVSVPSREGNFLCGLTPEGDVTVIWDPVWRGYTGLVLRVEQRIDGQLSGTPTELELGLDETNATLAGLAPIGSYSFALVASYDLPLPANLVASADSLTASCSLVFEPRVHLPSVVDGGVGASRIEIPVLADVEGTIEGFRFTLELPSFLTLGPNTGLETPFAGGTQTLEVVSDGAVQQATVTVRGISSAASLTGGDRLLATLFASAPVDFELPEESDLRFVDLTTIEFPTLGDTRVSTNDSSLLMHRRFVSLNRATIDAGSVEPVELTVSGTLDAPAPGYHLLAFTIHVAWDSDELEFLPVSQLDQAETVGAGLGTFILPNGAVLAAANDAGNVAIPWFGLDFSNVGELGFIEPGVDQPLLRLRFRSKLGAEVGTRFLPVTFLIEDADRNPTTFIPEIDIPGQPNLQGALDGGIQLIGAPSDQPLSLNALSPARGSFFGGREATLTGAGFRTDSSALLLELLVPLDGGGTQVVAVEEILEVTSGSVRFVMPDSGVRTLGGNALKADLRVTVGSESGLLEQAFSYEPPLLNAVTPSSGMAAGGEMVLLEGTGLPATATVSFRAGSDQATAVVLSSAADGTELRIETPDLTAHAGETASIDVLVAGIGTVTLSDAYSLLGDVPSDPLLLLSVEPAGGSICGGEEVTLTGQGFAVDAQVFFAGQQASGVVFLGGDRIRVTTPAMPEGTGAVTVLVTLGVAESAMLNGGFTYEPAGPTFRRGDVDGSGALSVADAVLLSDLLFGRSTSFPAARDASDANDDGLIDEADISAILSLISGDLISLPEPFQTLGFDPTPDAVVSCNG